MQFSENVNNLFSALAKFQAECPQITKDAKVKVKNRQGKFLYSFEYATYGNILKTVKPILANHELSVFHNIGADGVQTVITHSSGQWAKTDHLPILINKLEEGETVHANEQETGSSVTYKKRYQLAGLLFQDADQDDDANSADGNVAEFENKPKKSSPKKQKKAESKPEPKKTKKEEPDEDIDPVVDIGYEDEDAISAYIASETDQTRLIKWYQAGASGEDKESFIEQWQEDTMKRLAGLKNG